MSSDERGGYGYMVSPSNTVPSLKRETTGPMTTEDVYGSKAEYKCIYRQFENPDALLEEGIALLKKHQHQDP